MVHAPRIEEDGSPIHFRRLGVFGPKGQPVIGPVAPEHHPGGAVGFRERRKGPQRVALHFVAVGEREEVESPLIAMDRLGGLTRSDGDDLSEMQLEVAGVGQDQVGHSQGQGMEHQHPAGRGTGDERPGPPGVASAERIGAGRSEGQVGRQFVPDPIEQIHRCQTIDDDGAFGSDSLGDCFGGRIRREMGYGHATLRWSGRVVVPIMDAHRLRRNRDARPMPRHVRQPTTAGPRRRPTPTDVVPTSH